jgi:rhamnogalacturonyl hydrolase YesR
LAPEFESWPTGKSPEAIGALLTRNYLARPRAAYHYSDACAWFGALRFTKVTGDKARNAELVKTFNGYLSAPGYIPDGITVDDRVSGIVPLEIAVQNPGSSEKYLGIGLAPADAQYEEYDPELARARHWVDDMFMITALQVQAYRASRDAKYRDFAVRAMLDYHASLQQENGLFWHTRESHTHWGRGNGWCAVGMSELLEVLGPGDEHDRIMNGYRKMMAALRATQVPQGEKGAGLWRQVLDYPESWTELSSTAMFTTAIANGLRNGWLDAAEYARVARDGFIALTRELEPDGDLPRVCVGTGAAPVGSAESQRDFYLRCARSTGDLHGQAPVLWAARSLILGRR